jgi:hypothetical protein
MILFSCASWGGEIVGIGSCGHNNGLAVSVRPGISINFTVRTVIANVVHATAEREQQPGPATLNTLGGEDASPCLTSHSQPEPAASEFDILSSSRRKLECQNAAVTNMTGFKPNPITVLPSAMSATDNLLIQIPSPSSHQPCQRQTTF